MIQATYKDKSLIVDILTKSFDTNKSVNYVIIQDNKRERRIHKLMDYSFELCWMFGEIYLTPDKKGVVLILLPHKKKTTLYGIWQDLTLAFCSVGITRAFKVLDRESKIKKYHPKEFMYLWYIGVIPQEQSKGIGSSLLQEIINLGNQRNLPVYLETSTERNLPLYKRFNFKIYQELIFDYTLYLFKKEPDSIVA